MYGICVCVCVWGGGEISRNKLLISSRFLTNIQSVQTRGASIICSTLNSPSHPMHPLLNLSAAESDDLDVFFCLSLGTTYCTDTFFLNIFFLLTKTLCYIAVPPSIPGCGLMSSFAIAMGQLVLVTLIMCQFPNQT